MHVTIIETRYEMVENRRLVTLLLFPSNTDLPRSTFRRWLEVKVVPQTSARAPNVESYNLHTLPPYPKNLSPTPSCGPNAIEWSVSRQAAGSIGFVPDTTIFLLFPFSLLDFFPHSLALSFPLYTISIVTELFLSFALSFVSRASRGAP